MSEDFRRDMIEGRRLYLLRFMVEAGGSCLENFLVRAGLKAFRQASEEQLKADIVHLENMACLKVDLLDTADGAHALRHLELTTRGEMAADGRGEPVPGIQHSRWKR